MSSAENVHSGHRRSSTLDRAGLQALLPAPSSVLVEELEAQIATLVDANADDARLTLISRRLAAADAAASMFETLIGERLRKKDLQALETVDKLLWSATRRVALLAREHALQRSLTLRPATFLPVVGGR